MLVLGKATAFFEEIEFAIWRSVCISIMVFRYMAKPQTLL